MNRKDMERLINTKTEQKVAEINSKRAQEVRALERVMDEEKDKMFEEFQAIADKKGIKLRRNGMFTSEYTPEQNKIIADAKAEELKIRKQGEDLILTIILLGIKEPETLALIKQYLNLAV